jgi:hypothetical protein
MAGTPRIWAGFSLTHQLSNEGNHIALAMLFRDLGVLSLPCWC